MGNDGRWTSVGATMAKAQVAYDNAWDTATLDEDDQSATSSVGPACTR
ncbi:MAG: hypothetical protein R2713_21815 [Ilumatobacteraceae bacterium]